MSAWYLFSVMGFYPVTPASNVFALGAPQFSKVTIDITVPKTGKTHTLTIEAKGLNESKKYVSSVTVDGVKLTGHLITYDQLLNASNITFTMCE